MKANLRIAIVQKGPVFMDLDNSIKKMHSIIEETAAQKVDLIVFGESWLTGYPAWLDHCRGYATWNHQPTKSVFAKMYQNSVQIPGPEIKALQSLAKQYQIVIVSGVNEIVRSGPGNRTIYNSLVIIDNDGKLVNHRRKLMPTYTEKLLYGWGDGKGLTAVDTGVGRIGALICWEHWMPLTRQAMHDSGEVIHIALWPQVHEMLQIASRAYAFEGRCFVVAVGQMMYAKDFPPGLNMPAPLQDQPETTVLNGGSAIIGPDGKYLLDPQYNLDDIIYYDLTDSGRIYEESMTLDVSGHYQRPDVFEFNLKSKK